MAPSRRQRPQPTLRAYENAIHLVFDHHPTELVGSVLQLSGGGGPVCRQTVSTLVNSPQEPAVEFLNTVVPSGTLEPSFGCKVLTDVTSSTLPPSRRPPREYLRYWVLRPSPPLNDQQLENLSETIGQKGGIRLSTPVRTARPPADPYVGDGSTADSSPSFPMGTQWYLFQTKVLEASEGLWPPSSGTPPIVAVVDWGFRPTHQELAKVLNMEQAFNACDLSQTVDWGPKRYHGTAVVGLLAAVADGVGMQGMVPGIEVWPIKGDCENPMDGVAWAVAVEHVRTAEAGTRRKILLLEVESGTGESFESDPAICIAVKTAIESGVVVVMPAGNGSMDAGTTASGGSIEASGAILVGATEFEDPTKAASYSNFGSRVLVWAPGDDENDLTISDEADDAYMMSLGYTSGAAPKVTGVVALLLLKDPAMVHSDVIKALLKGPAVAGQTGKQLDAMSALGP